MGRILGNETIFVAKYVVLPADPHIYTDALLELVCTVELAEPAFAGCDQPTLLIATDGITALSDEDLLYSVPEGSAMQRKCVIWHREAAPPEVFALTRNKDLGIASLGQYTTCFPGKEQVMCVTVGQGSIVAVLSDDMTYRAYYIATGDVTSPPMQTHQLGFAKGSIVLERVSYD